MCEVLIIERPQRCHVFCECGFVEALEEVPECCPACGRPWDRAKVKSRD